MDKDNRKIEERQEQNTPMDNHERTLHEQDEDLEQKLNELYKELKDKQISSGDGAETYTNGYRCGHTNGQVELLERILNIDAGIKHDLKEQF